MWSPDSIGYYMSGIMLKKYVIIVCVLSMLFIAACDRKSVNVK